MPIIEMYVPEGVLSEEKKQALHERVARQVLEAEGATYDESPRAQSITWMLIHEMPQGSWSVGSRTLTPDDELKILTRVTVPIGALDGDRQSTIAARLNKEIVGVLGDDLADPTKSICVIEEELLGGGGVVVDFADLLRWLDLPERAVADGHQPAGAVPMGGGGI